MAAVVPRIEAAVEHVVRRLRLESEQLQAATEERFADLERELRAANALRASELKRSQKSLEEQLARRSAELVATSERLADVLAAEFGRLYRHTVALHPAAAQLADLQTRIKQLAGDLSAPADRRGEPAPGERDETAQG